MNGLQRWKENRIRQEILLAHLKHTQASSNGAGAHEAYPLGWNGTSILFLERTPGTRSDKQTSNRRKEHRLPWMILRLALLAVGLAAWLWLALDVLGPVRKPPMMPLTKPEVNHNAVDDLTVDVPYSGR
jgi:hypothetical protein